MVKNGVVTADVVPKPTQMVNTTCSKHDQVALLQNVTQTVIPHAAVVMVIVATEPTAMATATAIVTTAKTTVVTEAMSKGGVLIIGVVQKEIQMEYFRSS